MARDLEQLLHDTAVEPSKAIPPTTLIARGRRRRRRRHAAIVSVPFAVLVGVAVLVAGPWMDPRLPEIADQPPGDTEPEPDPDATEPDRDTEPAPPPGDQPETIPIADASMPLLAYGPDGLRRIMPGGEVVLWSGEVAVAWPERLGGLVVQHPASTDPWEPGRIQWLLALPDIATGPVIAHPEERPVLHSVVELDGQPTVLFTRRTGTGENQTETLYARVLGEEGDRELGVTGGLESFLDGAAVHRDQLVLSRCHLQCNLVMVPLGADPEGDEAVQLLPGPGWLYGLDVEGGTAAYVELAPPDMPDEAEPVLWLHDLDRNERRAVALPALEPDAGSAVVDLAPDADAALVTFGHWEMQDRVQVQVLLVDRLRGEPRLRWLDTDETVVFDVPGAAGAPEQPTADDEAVAATFLRFADDPGPSTFGDLDLADEVLLGLGDRIVDARGSDQLSEPAGWELAVEEFRAYTGPFSPLVVAADPPDVQVSVGPYPHCAAPPNPPPDEVADLRRVGIRPAVDAIETCLEWWAVDLYLTGDGRIRAVTLDLWEP